MRWTLSLPYRLTTWSIPRRTTVKGIGPFPPIKTLPSESTATLPLRAVLRLVQRLMRWEIGNELYLLVVPMRILAPRRVPGWWVRRFEIDRLQGVASSR